MVEDVVEDVVEDKEPAADVVTTAHVPMSNTPTTYLIFKDGVKNEANAVTLIVMNGATAVVSTSYTTAPTAATVWTATTPLLSGPIAPGSPQVVAHATVTSSSALAEDVGWIPIKIVM